MGIQKVKTQGFVGTREMEADFGVHGIGVLQTAGIWELNSLVAVAGLANHALVPRIGVGVARGAEHCMMQMVVEMLGTLGTEVGLADGWTVGIVVQQADDIPSVEWKGHGTDPGNP